MKNYYDLLEVTPKASNEVIEKAYKVLIKQCHPDLYIGEEKIYAEERTRQLNEAYHVLSDSFLRSQYDMELKREEDLKRSMKQRNNGVENKYNNATNNVNHNKSRNMNRQYDAEQPQQVKTHKVGSFMGVVDVFNAVFKKRKINSGKPKKLVREDWIAGILTLVIVIVLGIILWFVPATNGFIRSLIPF